MVAPQPSAAEVAADARRRAAALASQRRAAKRAAARRHAAKLAAARRQAAKLAAKRRAAEARANSARLQSLQGREANGTPANPRESVAKLWPEASDSGASRGPVIPLVAGLGALALLLLLIGLIPAQAAPWYWAERTLAARQQQFALSGVIGLCSVGVSFVVVFLTG